MNREEAYYYKLLLMSGFTDGYDEWLNGYLETEDPLSDIVLELSLCGSDIDQTISLLHNYCYCCEQKFDEALVCEKLRLFLKEYYHSHKMDKKEIVSAMYRFASNHGDPGDFDLCIWGSMFYLDYYYSLAKNGGVTWEWFDFAFSSYLNDGVPVDKLL